MTFGQKIEYRHKELGYTQVELAERVHTTQPYVSRLELCGKEKWKGIKTIGMVIRTYKGVTYGRYYISSLSSDIVQFSEAVRGHWSVESMHWQLDVTFKEDSDQLLDQTAAANRNLIRKWCISMLKHITFYRPNLSMKQKMSLISLDPAKFLDYVMSL